MSPLAEFWADGPPMIGGNIRHRRCLGARSDRAVESLSDVVSRSVIGRPLMNSVLMNQGSVMRLAPQRSRDESAPVADVRLVEDEELDRRIRAGWEEWCDLLEDLVRSGGMLPPRKLARRVEAFFEDAYWLAEEARMEALRRQCEAESLHLRRGLDCGRWIA